MLSRKIAVEMTPPYDQDTTDASARLLSALPRELEPVQLDLSALRQLPAACRVGEWTVTATLSWTPSCYHVVALAPGRGDCRVYGIAIDLGSTTVCGQLVDLETGDVVCQASVYNHQIAFGEDILTRVFACKDQLQKLEEIRRATVSSIGQVMDALRERSGYAVETCGAMTVAGNTTMVHFLLGLDAFCVFAAPYAPWVTQPEPMPARSLGIDMAGYVYLYPCRANYLGGDIVSGIVATGMMEREKICVFLDIGTNGELVVGNRDFLLAGAGAAGPALEGGVVKTGMRAVDGAVSYVKLQDDRFALTVIGGGTPKGLCGSGIVDLIAQLRLNGKIDLLGKFRREASLVKEIHGELGIAYAPGLYFVQSDVDEFLRTKAAANTMVEYMMDQIGMTMDDVDRFYVAGAFGAYLDRESAVTIGLYPDIPREKLCSAGNTSLEGARMLLCRREIWLALPGILKTMEYIQFGEVANFVDRMTAASAIPHTDMGRYPSVRRRLLERGVP